jgi:cytochrome P450
MERLERYVGGPGFDIYPYMNFITLDIICGKLMETRLKGRPCLFDAVVFVKASQVVPTLIKNTMFPV